MKWWKDNNMYRETEKRDVQKCVANEKDRMLKMCAGEFGHLM